MNNLNKYIDMYKNLVAEVYNEEDFKKQNKIDAKIDKIINSIYNENLENEFYNILFESHEPFVVAHISNISFYKNHNLKLSLEKMKWIKQNAQSLRFVENNEKNKKWQDYFANKSLKEMEDRLALYNKINDKNLFNKFFAFQQICDDLFQNYLIKRNWFDKKQELLLSIEELEEKSKFFEICLEKFKEAKTPLYAILTYYAMCKFNYNRQEAIYALKNINETEINQILLKLRNEILTEIA